MARRKIIAGNWKMNKTPSEAVALVNELKPLVANEDVDVVFCVPAIDIIPAMIAAKDSNICIGAENMYFEESGAYTGEISPNMLVDAGVKYVVLGHSERREYFAETDETVNKKVLKVLAEGLKPIVCVGESLQQKQTNITNEVVCMQTKAALCGVSPAKVTDVVIAYEPIWAIGTGMVATPQSAQDAANAIRNDLKTTFGTKVSDSVRILYGGSVTSKNAAELISQPDVDGFLIGGAALDVEELAKIARLALKSTKSRN